ncbi:MAG: hypothetical protein Q8905_09300, partial [Bacteroidota bacterium]|nr:hypothetical protein [Bacteroidota bacterium]
FRITESIDNGQEKFSVDVTFVAKLAHRFFSKAQSDAETSNDWDEQVIVMDYLSHFHIRSQ